MRKSAKGKAMNSRFWKSFRIVLLLCAILVCLNGGMFGCAYKATPQNFITALNNTTAFLDIELTSQDSNEIVVKNLGPGQTFQIKTKSFYDGQRVSLIATGRDADGTYIGAATKSFEVIFRYPGGLGHGGHYGSIYHWAPEPVVWKVERLRPPSDQHERRW